MHRTWTLFSAFKAVAVALPTIQSPQVQVANTLPQWGATEFKKDDYVIPTFFLQQGKYRFSNPAHIQVPVDNKLKTSELLVVPREDVYRGRSVFPLVARLPKSTTSTSETPAAAVGFWQASRYRRAGTNMRARILLRYHVGETKALHTTSISARRVVRLGSRGPKRLDENKPLDAGAPLVELSNKSIKKVRVNGSGIEEEGDGSSTEGEVARTNAGGKQWSYMKLDVSALNVEPVPFGVLAFWGEDGTAQVALVDESQKEELGYLYTLIDRDTVVMRSGKQPESQGFVTCKSSRPDEQLNVGRIGGNMDLTKEEVHNKRNPLGCSVETQKLPTAWTELDLSNIGSINDARDGSAAEAVEEEQPRPAQDDSDSNSSYRHDPTRPAT